MFYVSPSEFVGRRDIRVLGIDPSIANCGWGVIEVGRLVECGVIHPASRGEFERYEEIERRLTEVIERLKPDIASVEQFQHFFRAPEGATEPNGSRRGRHNRKQANPDSMFKLKGAQTTVVSTCLRLGLGVVCYFPQQWKGAKEKSVNRMMMDGLYKVKLPNDDTADGVGLAHHYLSFRRGIDPVMYSGEPQGDVRLWVQPIDPLASARKALRKSA